MQKESAQDRKKQEISNNAVSKSNIHENEGYNPVKGEMALWSAVITQALMDAGSESRKPEAQHEKAKAIRWLLGNSEDFITVCLNAGLDPHYIRSKAKEAIERGCVWRSGMAKTRQPLAAAPASLQRKYYIPTPPPNQPTAPRAVPRAFPLPQNSKGKNLTWRSLRQTPHILPAASALSRQHS